MSAGVGSYPADWKLAGGIRVRSTGCAHGDLAGGGRAVERRRRAVVDLPWTVLRQVHGSRVVVVEKPGGASGEPADAAVTTVADAALAVLTADCAPVGLASEEGILGVAHVGWRGLRGGVVEATVHTMRRLGATRIEAVLGPAIQPCCYSFGAHDLEEMATRFGPVVRATDREGKPAFDLPATVRHVLHISGTAVVGDSGVCTGCSESHWSWRSDRSAHRQATVVWRS
jgi:polyphenol oxidase